VGIKAVTVHGRTRAQFYKGAVDWRAVAAVKAAIQLPVIVNGDITDACSAQLALAQSGADALMIGRGAYGRPWIAAALQEALEDGVPLKEPAPLAQLAIALDHLLESLRFYGDALGLRVFRKHLGWYVETATLPLAAERRRAAKSALCRLETPGAVETGLKQLWQAA
jgi:tRNA-dihydrouridine synthase